MIHALKQSTEYFGDVISGKKTFEVRRNDRPYKVGDLLALNEFDVKKQSYTGNSCLCYIDYILNDKDTPRNDYKFEVDYSVPYATRSEDK